MGWHEELTWLYHNHYQGSGGKTALAKALGVGTSTLGNWLYRRVDRRTNKSYTPEQQNQEAITALYEEYQDDVAPEDTMALR